MVNDREVFRLVGDPDQGFLLRLPEGLAALPSVKRETEIAPCLRGELRRLDWDAAPSGLAILRLRSSPSRACRPMAARTGRADG
jgi:hypothetical protein